MWDLETAKKILNRDGENYADEEVKKIAELIFTLAEVSVECFLNELIKTNEKGIIDEQSVV